MKKIDLRGTPCPINFVRIKLILDEAPSGTELEAIIDSGEAYDSVPQSLKEEGHKMISLESFEEQFWKITVKKS